MKQLPQYLLRHLKGKLSFWQVEAARMVLSALREGITRKQFHALCDDLSRDTANYGTKPWCPICNGRKNLP